MTTKKAIIIIIPAIVLVFFLTVKNATKTLPWPDAPLYPQLMEYKPLQLNMDEKKNNGTNRRSLCTL
ncbi:hypothetical protein WKV44_08300 [Spirochaetia bacterium 38H-sp]|uniref:Uncharacterized protein n=1 Tax=Rarispira pelagica TaxID=3141764 RepID=A0ABU9UCZ5_9SPIR